MSNIEFSNKEDWSETFEVYDYETGDVIAKSLVSDIKLELEDPNSKTPELQGSISGGELTEEDPTLAIYTWNFPFGQTAKLIQQRYDFAAIMDTTDGARIQLWRVKATVTDGIVNE